MIRLFGGVAASLAIALIAATQVPGHERLPVAAVAPGSVLTQSFGCTPVDLEPFDAACPTRHFHSGIDLAAALGTAVYAATSGLASAGTATDGCGLYVAVQMDAHVRVVYCHLSALRVASGDSVEAGGLIGLMGESGLATGPHLHLQVDVDGTPVDPAVFLSAG